MLKFRIYDLQLRHNNDVPTPTLFPKDVVLKHQSIVQKKCQNHLICVISARNARGDHTTCSFRSTDNINMHVSTCKPKIQYIISNIKANKC